MCLPTLPESVPKKTQRRGNGEAQRRTIYSLRLSVSPPLRLFLARHGLKIDLKMGRCSLQDAIATSSMNLTISHNYNRISIVGFVNTTMRRSKSAFWRSIPLEDPPSIIIVIVMHMTQRKERLYKSATVHFADYL